MSNQNEPAFPTQHDMDEQGNLILCGGKLGLTKLEYFAGLAMQGILSTEPACINIEDKIAFASVRCAQALIAELDKQP